MPNLAELIAGSDAFLVDRVVSYAHRMGYSRYTPADPAVWKISVAGLSAGLVSALNKSTEPSELLADLDFAADSITSFGIEAARKHRARGVSLQMFLGLMKYFRQSYHDLVDDAGWSGTYCHWAHRYLERYFDKVELGFIAEWERSAAAFNLRQEELLMARNADLTATNELLQQQIIDRRRAEQQISKLNADLERRVAARTLQLQRVNEENHYKLKELLLLNRFSSLNLSTVRLNKLSQIILTTLTSEPALFFERAMLLLLNERAEVLQGMLGVVGRQGTAATLSDESRVSDDDAMHHAAEAALNQELRASRITLKKGRGIFYRTVAEKRVVAVRAGSELEPDAIALCRRCQITSFALMPLVGKNRVFGVILVDNPVSRRKVSRNDLKFLQLFANHAGVAVENVMLYSNLEDANRRLHEAQEQLIHGERLATIGEMSAGIAHELKGPLIAMGGFARRLARKIPADSQEGAYIATIIEEEQRLEHLLDEILSFSKKTTICFERCSIVETVESALGILVHAVEKSGVQVQKSSPKKDIMLYGDGQQLKQVFINLLHNALEVMRDGGLLRISFAVSQLGKRKAAAIKIADSGGGVSLEVKNKIFNPFFTTKCNGTGLGLPIANRIVANHGGKIRLRNHAGGAEFTVLLPCE